MSPCLVPTPPNPPAPILSALHLKLNVHHLFSISSDKICAYMIPFDVHHVMEPFRKPACSLRPDRAWAISNRTTRPGLLLVDEIFDGKAASWSLDAVQTQLLIMLSIYVFLRMFTRAPR